MSRIYTLKSTQRLPVSLEETWKFFSDPGNLLTITPPFLNLKVPASQYLVRPGLMKITLTTNVQENLGNELQK